MQTMQAPITDSCSCGSVGRSDLRQCPSHFHIWSGDRRLASVGSIIRSCWPAPEKPIPADILENARDRGDVTDKLFGAYCLGRLTKIPRGTRQDAVALFKKLQDWFDAQNFKDVHVQVLLGSEDYGGVLDFRFDGVPVDLKCTYDVQQTAIMQVAAYAALDGTNGGHILHVTERFKEPKLVNVLGEEIKDWHTMLAHWRMIQRRTASR